jgi:hypothetical protein
MSLKREQFGSGWGRGMKWAKNQYARWKRRLFKKNPEAPEPKYRGYR